ncbi:uncharacterized protein LOC134215219 [Armigeres subalbatus]|uniref:uncharacterized protein LOC134215219 n=1 Tax=Armigeres subalbatus TaxID=124917 RepID=UPI002ED676B6
MSQSANQPFCSRNSKTLLSGRDMLRHHVGNYDYPATIRLVQPDEEVEQQENISKIKDDFRIILAQQRVGRGDNYSEGEWHNERKRVYIRKAVGKWHLYGYLENMKRYVEAYEALHLIEMNRLVVFWDTIIISLEQAYGLFLGIPESLSLEYYKVYSTMMRAGIYLLKYDPKREYRMETECIESDLDEERACVWRNLYKILRQPNSLVEQNLGVDSVLMRRVERSMENYNLSIAQQLNPSDENEQSDEYEVAKRKDDDSSADQPSKRQRTETMPEPEVENKSKLDRFLDLFDSFDVIRSTVEAELETDQKLPNTTPHFDVFLNSDGTTFRKSQPFIPDYRMIIRTSSEPLLTSNDIASLYHRQPKPDVPVLLMQVGETLSVHCFLYRFCSLHKNLVLVSPDCSRKEAITRYYNDDDDNDADADSSESSDENKNE